MEIEYLVRGKKQRDIFCGVSLPDDVSRRVGIYEAEGGSLYLISFSTGRNTIADAEILSLLRGSLPLDKNVRTLRDDASAKFDNTLYPLVNKFERALRTVLTLAVCAVQGNFDDSRVKGFEGAVLSSYKNYLFFDYKFKESLNELNNAVLLSNDDFFSAINSLERKPLWDALFDKDDMPSVRSNFDILITRRNDVMHFHSMDVGTYKQTKMLLLKANREINVCIRRIRSDINYPRQRAADVQEAMRALNEALTISQAQYASLGEAIKTLMKNYPIPYGLFASYFDTDALQTMSKTITEAMSTISTDQLNSMLSFFTSEVIPNLGVSSIVSEVARTASISTHSISATNTHSGPVTFSPTNDAETHEGSVSKPQDDASGRMDSTDDNNSISGR